MKYIASPVIVAPIWLAFVLAILYWSGLHGDFFFDDLPNILESNEVQIQELSWRTLGGVWGGGVAGPLGRPLSMLSFALNYYFSGFSPFVFKATNLVIHFVNSVLVFYLLKIIYQATVKTKYTKSVNGLLLVLATIWAAHPIQLTSVLYVVQRMTALSALFLMAGLISYIQARESDCLNFMKSKGVLLAWVLFFPLSLLCKETGILFVGYIAAYELIIRRKSKGGLDNFALYYLLSLAVFVVFAFLYIILNPNWLMGGYHSRSFGLVERLYTEGRILWSYIDLLFLPSLPNYSLFHDDVLISTGIFDPVSTAYSILGIVLVAGVAWWCRNKFVLISFAIVWFFVGHSLESSIIPLELMHEHRNYLPSLSLAFLMLSFSTCNILDAEKYRGLGYWVLGGVLLYFAFVTYLRADMYGNEFRRTQVEAQYHENSVRSLYDAGSWLVNLYNHSHSDAQRAMADKLFEKANAADKNFKMALIGMLQLDCLSGNEIRSNIYNELVSRFSAGPVSVHERTSMAGIFNAQVGGVLCLSRSQVDELFDSFMSNPSATVSDKVKAINRYAIYLWLEQKDYALAEEMFDWAFSYGDEDPVNRLNALQLARARGDKAKVNSLLNYIRGVRLGKLNESRLAEIENELASEEGGGGGMR